MRKESSVWNFYAPVYNMFTRSNGKAYEQMYALIREAVRGMKVLEAATGTGLIAKSIASAAKQVVATDFAEKMLTEARKGDVPQNVSFEWADVTKLPFEDACFDAVIIANALHIIPKPARALSELGRVLKPGGVLIAPNFVAQASARGRLISRLLSWAGVAFEAAWDETGYARFLHENGWRITKSERLLAVPPLMYAQCVRISETD